MTSRSKVFIKNKQCSRLQIEVIRRQKCLRRAFRYFPCRLPNGVCRQSFRRLLSLLLFLGVAASKFPRSSTPCAHFVSCDAHLVVVSFGLSALPHRKPLRICPFALRIALLRDTKTSFTLKQSPKFNFTTPS